MAVKMRLTRMGDKKSPFYRIVVVDSRKARDGEYIDLIGTYAPVEQPAKVKIDVEKAKDWLSKGVQPTETVRSLLVSEGVLQAKPVKKPSKRDLAKAEAAKAAAKADIIQDETNFNFFINRLSANYNYITECADILRGNTNIDVKFYNTYGRSHNYTIGDDGEMIDRVNIAIKFKVTLVDGADELSARKTITTFVKQFIERVNAENGANNLYISNLIRELENSIPSIHYLKFMGINDYDTNYQTISIKESDINNLTKEDRRNYVPEIIVVNPDDIQLAIITN